MGVAGGPNIEREGLVFALDGGSRRSTLRRTQSNNILPDSGKWATGTGGQTGYSPNGSNSEQNRVLVNDDPWGRTSVTWRTTPDATSGADGGWNTSYYSVDINYTYRYSVWVRRYTAGTGGTFYMGMNPNPIRNDNDSSQGNPYFTYPSIASLTENQWYLVVGHVFYEGYTGGRHPESGWYENGVKISDKSYGNVGAQDVRWASGTTTARHRTYHYYTTNTSSGIEFASPRVDKIDGKEPSISELIRKGDSGWKGLVSKNRFTLPAGLEYSNAGVKSGFVFDGTDDYVSIDSVADLIAGGDFSLEAIIKGSTQDHKSIISINTSGGDNRMLWMVRNAGMGIYDGSTWYIGDEDVDDNNFHHIVLTYDFSTKNAKIYTDNILDTNVITGNQINISASDKVSIGMEYDGASPSDLFSGEIPVAKVYDKILSAQEVQQNFKAYKNRFNI